MDTVIFVLLILAVLFVGLEAFRVTARTVVFGWLGLCIFIIAAGVLPRL